MAILDVGHGNSAVLIDERGVVVIDAGPGSALLEFLTQEGITRVDVLLISHADADHIGGVIGLLSANIVSIGQVRLNSDAQKGSDTWRDLLAALEDAHHAGQIQFEVALHAGHSGLFDQGPVHIEILTPTMAKAGSGPGALDDAGRVLTTNSFSVVIRLVQGGQALALFPGDIDAAGLAELSRVCAVRRISSTSQDAPPAPRAFLTTFPHHGGKPGSNARRATMQAFARAFCELVQPQVVVFSIGRGQHETPQPDIVTAVRAQVPDVRIACTQLSERCAAALPATIPSHLANRFAAGIEKQQCCGGTIVLDLDSQIVRPSNTNHQEFITLSAPTALCRLRIV